MAQRSWSLSRRIVIRLAVTTAVLVLVIAGLGGLYVHASTERELEALVEEELEEMKARFSITAGAPEDFELLVADLAAQHPESPMAWRVRRQSDGEIWGDFGATSLLTKVSPRRSSPRRMRTYEDYRWKTTDLNAELEVGVLLDVSYQLRFSRKFDLMAAGFVLGSAVLATMAGALLGRQIRGLLHSVAERARLARDTTEEVDLSVEGAPEEIQQVAHALQETLEKIREEAEKARLITSGLAHELRSPIQNLLGEIQVALMKQRGADEYRRVLESGLEELREFAQAVDNLVTLCAAGERRAGREAERFDLAREAQLRLERESSYARRKGVELEIVVEGSTEYQGDREAILLAIRNLVTNAIDWSEADGKVQLHLKQLGDELEIVVDDGGPGVPAEERTKIFEPFYRGKHPSGGRVGYGLGLALTRSAIESHGGHVEVEDSPLGGARMRAVLPGNAA